MNISERTLKIIETANQKEPLICGYNSTQIQRDYLNFLFFYKVKFIYKVSN